MDITTIFQMLVAIFAAIALYTIIGFMPGTDETSVLMPVTLAIVLAGTKPIVVFAFFISAMVTLNLMNAVPTALAGLPGGVMSTPMIPYTLYLKEKGLAAESIRKMAAGSIIGTMVALVISLILANLLAPFAGVLSDYRALLFVFGAIFLSLLSKNKLLSLLSIIPLAILFQGLRALYWQIGAVTKGSEIVISFFLGITIGPLMIRLLDLLNKKTRDEWPRYDDKVLMIEKQKEKMTNPFKILSPKETGTSVVVSALSNFLFFLSPVGLTILFGEAVASREKDPVKKSFQAITSMSALSHATYMSGLLIPLIALGIPLSPVAIGPANALFNAPPVFTLQHNLHHILSKPTFIYVTIFAAVISSVVTYIIAVRYAQNITTWVLRKIPHEAILAVFISLTILLAFKDAGFINIFGVLLISIVSGFLNRKGVNYGVQFMTLYAASWIVSAI